MVKYIENGRGFLSLNKQQIMQLTDMSISVSTATDEVASFDSNFVKSYLPTWSSWTADGSFIIDDTTSGYVTGTTSNVTGATNGVLLLETIKLRTALNLVIRLDTANFQKGSVIITSYDVKAQAGKMLTGLIKLQGSGALTKSTS